LESFSVFYHLIILIFKDTVSNSLKHFKNVVTVLMREFRCHTGTVIETDRKPEYRDYSEGNMTKRVYAYPANE